MALPTLTPRLSARKDMYERIIVSRRNKENDFRQNWTNASNYFKNSDVKASKLNSWTSDKFFQHSMDAYKAKIDKEAKTCNLLRRQNKLTKLLEEERGKYQEELSSLSRDGQELADMKERADGLKSAREEKRKQDAAEKLYEHWRTNNPDIRKVESEQHKDFVVNSWKSQIEENEERLATARREKEEYERQAEAQRLGAVRRQEDEERSRLQSAREIKDTQRRQMEELKYREKEAKRLKKEEDALIAHKWEIDEFEEIQRRKKEESKKQQFGRLLMKQHVAQLKRKSHIVQQELEQDMEMLRLLIEKEKEDSDTLSARREQAKADAAWMRDVLQEQLKLEKIREAEMEMIYQHEATRMWEKRESEWSRERNARQRLMKEVLDARQEQIQRRLEDIQHEKQESLKQRQQLLEELEVADQIKREEQEHIAEAQITRRRELEEQIKTRRDERDNEMLKLKLDFDEEEQERLDEGDLLRLETERMRLEGYTPRDLGRRNQAWC